MHLTIPHLAHEVVITAESPDLPRLTPHSAGSASGSDAEYFFGDDRYCPSSRHRISISRGGTILVSRVLLSTGGGSGVHARSAFVHGDTCFVAVGPFVCALELPTLRLLWHTRADTATCFAIHDAPGHASIISHGESEIARLSYSGQLLWSGSGRDIFSKGFELHEHYAEAIDFNGTRYRFDLETGRSQIVVT